MRSFPTRRRAVALSASALASVALLPSRVPAAEINLKFGTTEPIGSPLNNRALQAFDRIRKETNGRVDVQLFPNNVLGGLTAMVGQVRTGALNFVPADGITISGLVPEAAIAGIGFAFRDVAHGFAAFDGELGKYVRSRIEAKGLYAHNRMLVIGMRHITSSPRPIQAPDDLSGFKIRTPPGRLSVDLFKTFGASVLPMDIAETYTALQTHVIDGQENPFFLIEIDHFYEVQKYLSLTSHQWSAFWLIGNQDAWNAIPPDLQAVVDRNFTIMAMQQRRDVNLMNDTLLDKLKRRGMIVNRPDQKPFQAKLAPFYQRWKSEFGPAAWNLLEKYAGKLG